MRPEWVYGDHPPACTCWRCVDFRAAPRPTPRRRNVRRYTEERSTDRPDRSLIPPTKPSGSSGCFWIIVISIVISVAVAAGIFQWIRTSDNSSSARSEESAANSSSEVKVYKGFLLEEFQCIASRDGYKGQARITNNGKTQRDVSIEIYALAADQEELHGVRSDSKDIPNGVTVDFSHSGSYHNPSYIKYCNIRIVIPEPGFTPKNINELFKGKYQTLKFKTAEGLELPLAFNIPSNKPPGLTGSACKPDASEYDASKDECGRTALRSGSVWQNKFTAHENNCD